MRRPVERDERFASNKPVKNYVLTGRRKCETLGDPETRRQARRLVPPKKMGTLIIQMGIYLQIPRRHAMEKCASASSALLVTPMIVTLSQAQPNTSER